jgi:hypothetical protein
MQTALSRQSYVSIYNQFKEHQYFLLLLHFFNFEHFFALENLYICVHLVHICIARDLAIQHGFQRGVSTQSPTGIYFVL